MCDLAVVHLTSHDDDPPAGRLDEGGVIGRFATTGMSGPQHRGTKRLRSLNGHQCRAIGGVDHGPVGVDDFDRVGYGNAGNRRVGAIVHRVDHTPVELFGRQRTSGVVDADDIDIIGHRVESGAHAGAAGVAAGDPRLTIHVTGRYHHNHAVRGLLGDTPRTVDHTLSAEWLVLFQAPVPQAASSADNDGPHLRRTTHRCEGSTVSNTMTDHIERLSRTSFFSDAAPDMLQRVADAGTERNLTRGDVLFDEGDPPDALYLVVHGRIAIAMSSPVDRRESVVALMEPGDLFGELGMLDHGPRSAMARALEPSSVLEVPFEPVRRMFEEDPRLLWNVTRLLATRLRVMDEVLADSVFLDVTGRTAKRLLELANGSDEFQLPVTQEELAGMVGASRERVNKAIASFIKLGWLEQHERNYRIVQRDRLELRAR